MTSSSPQNLRCVGANFLVLATTVIVVSVACVLIFVFVLVLLLLPRLLHPVLTSIFEYAGCPFSTKWNYG